MEVQVLLLWGGKNLSGFDIVFCGFVRCKTEFSFPRALGVFSSMAFWVLGIRIQNGECQSLRFVRRVVNSTPSRVPIWEFPEIRLWGPFL